MCFAICNVCVVLVVVGWSEGPTCCITQSPFFVSVTGQTNSSQWHTSCSAPVLKPAAMAGQRDHRNDSSQMKELLQFDELPLQQREHEQECSSKESSSLAGCCSSSSYSTPSSSCAPASSGAVGGRGAEEDEPPCPQRDDGASSSCLLDDLKRLPRCSNKLGHLNYSRMHTVLVNVRARPFQPLPLLSL